MKICTICKIEKDDIYFYNKNYRCKGCQKEYTKQYNTANKERIDNYNHQYYLNNKDSIKEQQTNNKDNIQKYRKQYYADNVDTCRERNRKYLANNKEKRRRYKNEHETNKRRTDPSYKLRVYVSVYIGGTLKKSGGSKNGISCFKKLPYSPQQLMKHLESQFEPWMNKNNHGEYDTKTWKDNDSSTWKWQLDHIIPQSDLPFTSMEDDNFKKCWALENLRPLSAKQNILDGVNKTRHNQKNDLPNKTH